METQIDDQDSDIQESEEVSLSEDQELACDHLRSGKNVFLTGVAGSGKSYVVRSFTEGLDSKEFPILASTGRAAILIAGRTFHSFFGLGIMEGGVQATFERAQKDKVLFRRLRKVQGVIIDEISMVPGYALAVAEALARSARGKDLPWGGMQVITVGDFAQLPPVSRSGGKSQWAFLNPVWEKTNFINSVLTNNHRTEDLEFLNILNDVRLGIVSERVRGFLEDKECYLDIDFDGTRLFPRRNQTDQLNRQRLSNLDSEEEKIATVYFGDERYSESLKKKAPIPEILVLKNNCRVMFLQNDPKKRWVNGTTGVVREIENEKIRVLLDSGRSVNVEKGTFSLLNQKGDVVASAMNFPLTLAYASTIHKSQGMTLEKVGVDIRHLWEPGQAYVALSRLKSGRGLFLEGWNPRSIFVDPLVQGFYSHIQGVNL